MDKILVTIALQRAETYEEQGDKVKTEYWLELAEGAERVYNKIEKTGGLNENFRSNK